MQELCPEMHSIKCMPISISVTRCSLAHHFWQEMRKLKVIKCPVTQRHKNRNPNPNLKDNPNTNANPKVKNRDFTLWLDQTLRHVDENGVCILLINILSLVAQWPNLRSSGGRQYITLINFNFHSKFVLCWRPFDNNNHNHHHHRLSYSVGIPASSTLWISWRTSTAESTMTANLSRTHLLLSKKLIEATMNAKYSSSKEIQKMFASGIRYPTEVWNLATYWIRKPLRGNLDSTNFPEFCKMPRDILTYGDNSHKSQLKNFLNFSFVARRF